MYRRPERAARGRLFGFQGDLNPVDTDDSSSNVFRLQQPLRRLLPRAVSRMEDFRIAPPGQSQTSSTVSDADKLPPDLLEEFLVDDDAAYEHRCQPATSASIYPGPYKLYHQCQLWQQLETLCYHSAFHNHHCHYTINLIVVICTVLQHARAFEISGSISEISGSISGFRTPPRDQSDYSISLSYSLIDVIKYS